MAVNTDRSVIILGSRDNKQRQIFAIPAQSVADMPGILILQAVNDSGVVSDYYYWTDSSGNLRQHTSKPTNQDSDGTTIAASGANAALSNLASVAINTTLKSDTDNTDDLGSASKEWKDLYIDGVANIDSLMGDIAELGGATNYVKVAAGGVTTLEGSATFDGIATGNFVDKSATETVSGAWTFSNAAGVTTNTLTERSAGSGVTIDSLLIKDEELYLSNDNKRIMFGDDDATDSYIKFNGTNLVFYDSAVAAEKTLADLSSATGTFAGDVTITDGKLTWTDAVDEAAGVWTFAATTADSIAISAANTTADVIQATANSLTSGSIFRAVAADGTLTSGNYFEAYKSDGGGATVFEVGKYGATTIAGNAATTVLAITAGNIVLSNGSITFTQNSDTVAFTHDGTDATFTTTDGVFLFKTAEGTNTATYMELKPKGSSEVSSLAFYDTDSKELEIATTGAGAAAITGQTALTVYGSVASAGNLALHSTSHGTKGTVTVGGTLSIADNSDTLALSCDGTNAYIKQSDGSVIFQTDEGTAGANQATWLYVYPKNAADAGFACLDQDGSNEFDIYQTDGASVIAPAAGDPLNIDPSVYGSAVNFYSSSGSAENNTVNIYGYITEKAGAAGPLAGTFQMEDTNNEFVIGAQNDTGHEGVSVSLLETNQRFRVRQNSDIFSVNLDGTNTYLYTSDGNFIFKTDEGTNTATVVEIKPKGTSEVSTLNLYDTDTLNLTLVTAAGRSYIRSAEGALGINDDAAQGVYFYESAASTENPITRFYGFATAGTAARYGYLQFEDTNDEFVIGAENNANHEGVTLKINEANQRVRFRDNGGNVSVLLAPSGIVDLAGQTITTVNASGSADLTTWCDTFNGANGSDDEDPKYAFEIKVAGTSYFIPCFTSV